MEISRKKYTCDNHQVCRAWQGEAGLQTKEVTLRIKVIPTLLEREVLQPSETSWFQAEWS